MLPDLVAAVRRAGIRVGTDRLEALYRALDQAGPDHLYWVGRLTLCGSPDDVARYDLAFTVFAGSAGESPSRGTPWQVRRLPERTLFQAVGGPGDAAEGDPGLAVRAS